MEQILKTTTRVVSSCSRGLVKSVIYFLRLNKISLISSLKSAIITAITEMNKLRKSIMDSYMMNSSRIPNLIAKKKAQPQKETELLISSYRLTRPFIPFLTKTKWIVKL